MAAGLGAVRESCPVLMELLKLMLGTPMPPPDCAVKSTNASPFSAPPFGLPNIQTFAQS